MIYFDDKKRNMRRNQILRILHFCGGGGALQLHLYGGVWPQDWKIDPSAD